ncbi:reverse transcriptase [Caerostris darwini]|uniref:Reverse transcriptase n=1 Tax=Caerostris darwini TaxID=1538125 RepID=A0AAV4X6E9_9ARAC|nr:reverse transcriptase [Caerostris darwini]
MLKVASSEKLADSNFNIPSKIDLLLGAELFYELLRLEQILVPNPNLLFQNVFAFVFNGKVNQLMRGEICCGMIVGDLNETLRNFCEAEGFEELKSKGENCTWEEHYAKTHWKKAG